MNILFEKSNLDLKETIEYVLNQDLVDNLEGLKKEDYTVGCLVCQTVYKSAPKTDYENGHGGREITFCRKCNSDLIVSLDEVLENNCYEIKVSPIMIDGIPTLIFKEHNYKYCTCEVDGKVYEVWTGKAETECRNTLLPGVSRKLELLSRGNNWAKFRCPRSMYNIVILKSSSKEKETCGYFITPVENWENLTVR